MAEKLSPAASERLAAWRTGGFLPAWAQKSLDELVGAQAWEELEDRFFRDLSFGTGGMRGRSIGRQSAPTELGPGGVLQPANPAVGANNLNDMTVARATMGLYRSVQKLGTSKNPRPRLVIAHDVRHFSRRFAELCARVWVGLGGEAWLFTGPRSTPQLSFSVRALGADTGVVLTASHNPPHDNGFKAYAAHGGQVVPPLADDIVAAVLAIKLGELGPILQAATTGETWQTVAPDLEESYLAAVAQVPLDAPLIQARHPRMVYSALHGTGGVMIPKLLRRLGAEVIEVAPQMKFDPNFSTVKSPNPENLDASKMALDQGASSQAGVVMVTDPDGDRIAAAFRKSPTELKELTGNELAVLLAEYRFRRAKELGWMPAAGSNNAVLLKSFVTTPMLDAVARGHGVRCVNTLTGFKWMGAKLHGYEEKLFAGLATAGDRRSPAEIGALPPKERAALYLRHSAWMVLAAEESYGCLAGDKVRDKDANAAAAMVAELAAWLAAQQQSATEFLDELYVKHGFYTASLANLPFEGATGVAQMQKVLASMRSNPPTALGGIKIERATDFLLEHRDEEGEPVPREDFLLYDLTGGWRCAIRGSGTEPKMKIYFFIKEVLAKPGDRPALEAQLKTKFEAWRDAVVADAKQRAG